MKARSTNLNQSIELEEIHNALSNFSKSEDKVNIIYEQRRREMLESVERRFILCDSDNNEQLDVYETTVCLPQIARPFRRVDTDNDNLISFDEMAILAKAYQDNINSNQEPSWRDNFFEGVPSPAGGILVLTPLVISMTNFDYIKLDNNIIAPIFFITTSLLLISKFPTYSFKKIVIQRKTTIFLLFGIVLFFGLLLIYPFVAISMSAIAYLFMLPISYFHYNKLKKNNEDKENVEDDEFEDIL